MQKIIEKDRLSILIAHCAVFEKLQQIVHKEIEKILLNHKLELEIFCPSDHKNQMTNKELSLTYWPIRFTQNQLISKFRNGVDILLASDQIIESLEKPCENLARQPKITISLGANANSPSYMFIPALKKGLRDLDVASSEKDLGKLSIPVLSERISVSYKVPSYL